MTSKIRKFILGRAFVEKEAQINSCQQPLEKCRMRDAMLYFLTCSHENENQSNLETIRGKAEDALLHDLEIFHSYSHSREGTLACSWDEQTTLCASSFYIDKILLCICSSVQQIYHRQSIFKSLYSKDSTLQPIWKVLADHEESLAWLIECKQKHPDTNSLHDMAFLQNHLLTWLNNKGTFLTTYNIYRILISPLIGFLTPVMYVILSFLFLRFYFKIPFSFTDFIKLYTNLLFDTSVQDALFGSTITQFQRYSLLLSILFYFQGLFNSVEVARLVYRATRVIYQKTRGALTFFEHAERLQQECHTEMMEIPSCEFPWQTTLADVKRLPPHSGLPQRSFGDFLAIYHDLDMDKYKPLLQHTYILDALTSIAKWWFAAPHPRTVVKFIEPSASSRDMIPIVNIKGVYHPCLMSDMTSSLVKNDVQVDGVKNMIITGPNAGGKSTLLKSLVMAVYLAQTIGVAPCDSLEMTPFSYINTQISVPDVKGVSSLFEAEMRRAKYHLEKMKNLREDQFALVALDEIFNSTNPVEGISAAYAVAHAFGRNRRTVCMLTTHYHFLCGLEKECERPFHNYKMEVTQDKASGQVIAFPYKLHRGISRQFVALELLKRDQFDNELVQHALDIKQRLLKPTTQR